MTHTVCGQPVWFKPVPLDGHPLIIHMEPMCEKCGRIVLDDAELSPGRPWELVEDDADLPKA